MSGGLSLPAGGRSRAPAPRPVAPTIAARAPAAPRAADGTSRAAPASMEHARDRTAVRHADADLLGRARAGDRAAFGVLVERHHRTLAAVLRQRFGPRAPVEDLLQDVFARALGGLDGFRGHASFLTWATAIALHAGTDWRRKEERRRRLAPPADAEPDAAPDPAHEAAPGATAERREAWLRVRAALDGLPDAHRLAVTLRVVESHPYDEVAQRLGVSAQLARTWVSRGLRALRESLRDGDGEVSDA